MGKRKTLSEPPADLLPPEPPPAPPAPATETDALLKAAVDANLDIDKLERLIELKHREEDRRAAAEFAQAMAAFQSECPPIAKKSKANIVSKSGMSYGYTYAELDEIARTTAPILSKHGLTYTWDSESKDGLLACTCTLRHVAGHSVTATFAAPSDSKAGMSEAQKVAAALTFARRQSLVQVLGLTTTDPDTDGGQDTGETITDEQANELNDLIIEVGADRKRFLAFMRVDKLADIRASAYPAAVNALETKRKAVAG